MQPPVSDDFRAISGAIFWISGANEVLAVLRVH
jgi:hypothetical protein